MHTILVLAKNSKHFNSFCHEVIGRHGSPNIDVIYTLTNSDLRIENSRYLWISRPEYIRGFHGVDIEFLHDWFDGKTKEEIDEIKMLTSIARNP